MGELARPLAVTERAAGSLIHLGNSEECTPHSPSPPALWGWHLSQRERLGSCRSSATTKFVQFSNLLISSLRKLFKSFALPRYYEQGDDFIKQTTLGRISRAERNQFTALCDGVEYPAKLRGAFFEGDRERPVVGDWVEVTLSADGDSLIEAIRPRKSLLKRADQSGHAMGYVKTMQEQVMVANFDYVFILTSLNEDYSLNRIARYVSVTLEGGGIPVVILTKADLCPDVTPYLNEVRALSDKVQVHAISTHTGFGLEALQGYFRQGVTIALLGSSGVGKSTLMNKLLGREIMKTSAIRERDGKGRHTTTARQLFVQDGVTLIDTPGMRELGLVDVEVGVSGTFSDIEELAGQCRFRDCTHGGEPGCAIRKALEDGTLDARRWEMYQSLMGESRKNTDRKAIAIQRKKMNKSGNRRNW